MVGDELDGQGAGVTGGGGGVGRAGGGGPVTTAARPAGTAARPHLSGYATGKATQIRLTEHLALEGREHGVSAFVIHPGDVVTELSELTMADPDAQRWLPGFVGNLTRRKEAGEDPSPGLRRR